MKKPAPSQKPKQETKVSISSGRTVCITQDQCGETIKVVGPAGKIEFMVRLTAQGPVLSFGADSITIETKGDLGLRCRRFAVEAEQDIRFHSKGNFKQVIEGEGSVKVKKDLEISAQAVGVKGRLGEVAIEANDDLVLNGERVLLNCPTEEEIQRRLQAVSSFEELLAAPFYHHQSPRRLPKSEPVSEPFDAEES